MNTEVRPIEIKLELKRSNPNIETFDFNIDTSNGQIGLVPVNSDIIFTDANVLSDEEEFLSTGINHFVITLKCTLESSDNSFDFTVAVDDIGQVIIVPVSENSNFVECEIDSPEENIDTTLQEDVDEPGSWNKQQIEAFVKSYTNNFTVENDCLRSEYKSEHEYAIEVLKQHYHNVGESKEGEWYVVTFSDPLSSWYQKENKLITVELCEEIIDDLESNIKQAIKICEKITKYFDQLGIHSADIDPYMTNYLRGFIKSDGSDSVNCAEFRARVSDFKDNL